MQSNPNKKNMKTSSQKLVLALTASILAAGGAKAYDVSLSTNLPPVDFHGFASQGFLYSDTYNYLGDSSHGSFKFTEAGLNATMNPFPRTRITAQGFTYDVGEVGKYDVVLDYAQAEYTFNDYIGIRAGRICRPEGIYNDIQDVDLARTWVLLPQGMYNARWRDFWVTVDGGDVFGTLPLGKAGSLGYELYDGIQRPSMDGGFVNQKANTATPPNPPEPVTWINSPMLGGGQLWWNTPLDGFRAGVAVNYNHNMTFDTGGVQLQGSPITEHYSLEYLWKNWTFQAEYYNSVVDYDVTAGGHHVGSHDVNTDNWYAGA